MLYTHDMTKRFSSVTRLVLTGLIIAGFIGLIFLLTPMSLAGTQ